MTCQFLISPDRIPKDASLSSNMGTSIGTGAKFFLTQNIGLRFDMRAIYTMVNAETAIFCNGGCTIKVRSNGLVQTEIGAALLVRF